MTSAEPSPPVVRGSTSGVCDECGPAAARHHRRRLGRRPLHEQRHRLPRRRGPRDRRPPSRPRSRRGRQSSGSARHPSTSFSRPADVEAIVNLTPPGSHFEVSTAVLAAGKHLYNEKPLAMTKAQGEAILAEAAAKSLVVGAAPDITMGRSFRNALRLLADGLIGPAVFARCEAVLAGPESWHPRPQFLYAQRWRAALRHRAVLRHRAGRGARGRRVGLGHRNEEVGVADDRERSGCRNAVPRRGSVADRGQPAVRDGNRRADAADLRLGIAPRRPDGGLRRRRHAADAGPERRRHDGPVPARRLGLMGRPGALRDHARASARASRTSPGTSGATSPWSSAGNGRFTCST